MEVIGASEEEHVLFQLLPINSEVVWSMKTTRDLVSHMKLCGCAI